ncbi:hypothetical protein RJ639_026683 [Escallonia herrerae]|uniref:Peptidase C1A papain C-terminal domain-containing protein n=1 Tax=Escallonia herrerae TaxID=1293975 RepID=A0AA89BDG6_9ASTE|nr:hypothetical protein RJ639_026683 [Escallonia herrerae]
MPGLTTGNSFSILADVQYLENVVDEERSSQAGTQNHQLRGTTRKSLELAPLHLKLHLPYNNSVNHLAAANLAGSFTSSFVPASPSVALYRDRNPEGKETAAVDRNWGVNWAEAGVVSPVRDQDDVDGEIGDHDVLITGYEIDRDGNIMLIGLSGDSWVHFPQRRTSAVEAAAAECWVQFAAPTCYITAASGGTESLLAMVYGRQLCLSVQEVVDCHAGHDCKEGGRVVDVFWRFIHEGVCRECDYRYTGRRRSCKKHEFAKDRLSFIDGFATLIEGDDRPIDDKIHDHSVLITGYEIDEDGNSKMGRVYTRHPDILTSSPPRIVTPADFPQKVITPDGVPEYTFAECEEWRLPVPDLEGQSMEDDYSRGVNSCGFEKATSRVASITYDLFYKTAIGYTNSFCNLTSHFADSKEMGSKVDEYIEGGCLPLLVSPDKSNILIIIQNKSGVIRKTGIEFLIGGRCNLIGKCDLLTFYDQTVSEDSPAEFTGKGSVAKEPKTITVQLGSDLGQKECRKAAWIQTKTMRE